MLELFGCPVEKLDDPIFVRDALRNAAGVSRSSLLKEVSHRFAPQGVTALGLLAESHISIHTWPEHGYAAADIFTCGKTAEPEKACQYLVDVFEARRHSMRKLARGVVTSGTATDDTPPRDVKDPVKDDAPWRAPSFAPISG